jgi:hypothetical protein
VARAGDIEAVLADLRTGEPAEPTTLRAWAGGTRIELYRRDRYDRLADLAAGVLQRTGAVSRAVRHLDHDVSPRLVEAAAERIPEDFAPGSSSQNADLKRLNRRLLSTTKIELSAIAAPAIIGLSRPAAASGRAATL